MTNKTVWILTYAVNKYEQEGEYFLQAFAKKPTLQQVIDATEFVDCPKDSVHSLLKFCLHLLDTGYVKYGERVYYNLREITLA